jgi:four helix bundle protein
MELVRACYALTQKLPAQERYVLSAQLRRSAISIPANLAEGYARKGRREYLQFIAVAQGSLAELECQLELIKRLGFATHEEAANAQDLADGVGRMLRRLERALRNQGPSTSRCPAN